MVDELLEMGVENPFYCIGAVLVGLVIFFVLGVLMGNVTAMKVLVKWGIPVFSGKINRDYRMLHAVNKDGIGWLHIPSTCYSPVMTSKKGFYKKHNFMGGDSYRGELFVSESSTSSNLASIRNHSDNAVHDLSIIEGSVAVRTTSVRAAKFTFLKKYVNTDLRNTNPDIFLYDKDRIRVFHFLFAVEKELENRMALKLTDRTSFLNSMREMSYLDSGKPFENDVLILSGKTDIDTMLVFLVEKTEEVK